jgi:hypothetical protein
VSDRADLVWAAAFALEFGSAYTRWRSIERDRLFGTLPYGQGPELAASSMADTRAMQAAAMDARRAADYAVTGLHATEKPMRQWTLCDNCHEAMPILEEGQ